MNLEKERCLITGAGGFIGYHLSKKLINKCSSVLCLDNLNSYYDQELKKKRVKDIEEHAESLALSSEEYKFIEMDLREGNKVDSIVKKYAPSSICHLAAQPGVRYSFENPQSYIDNNITATINLLEAAHKYGVNDIVFASTSSVYGLSKKMPFNEDSSIDSTISVYAATKRACELLCHVYNKNYGIRFRILRFFTAYGEWSRPDMAPILFTKAIMSNEPIKVYNFGKMRRDFTYVGDIVEGFTAALTNKMDFEILNLGYGSSTDLMTFIETLENSLGHKAKKELLPIQPGEVTDTWADISKARKLLGFNPKVGINEGVPRFVDWYMNYYK